jgi:predicted porin
MQKKLIALAVVAAFSAPAFADVTMYGVADAAVVRASADGQKSDLLGYSGGLSSSRLGAKAAEDIGDMKAVVVLEYGLDAQSATGISGATTRQQMLALAGGFGTVASGYLQTTGYDWAVKFDPTAGSAVSPLQSVNSGFLVGSTAVAARAQRALAYISPNFNGLSFAVNYATALAGLGNLTVANTANDVKVSATLASVNYDWNALSVGGVYAKTSVPTGANSTSDYALGASYDFGPAKLLGTYQQTKSDAAGASANKAMSVSVVAPVGPGAIAASYAKNTIGGATNADGKGFVVAWLQGLSKTTTFYAAVEQVKNGSATRAYSVINNALAAPTLTLGGSSTLIAVGLNKKF